MEGKEKKKLLFDIKISLKCKKKKLMSFKNIDFTLADQSD
jgi:hypothetical protein